MPRLRRVSRRALLIACCSVLLLSAVALAWKIKPINQPLLDSINKEKSELIKQAEQSSDQSLTVLGNENCPLKVVGAKAKEIPGSLFTKLTGKETDLANVLSVPEATLVNSSEKVVTRFFVVVKDPPSRTNLSVLQSKIALKPGESYSITRAHFDQPEIVKVKGEDGRIRQKVIASGMDSEKMWMPLASRSTLFMTITKVDFEDGSSWIKEGEESK